MSECCKRKLQGVRGNRTYLLFKRCKMRKTALGMVVKRKTNNSERDQNNSVLDITPGEYEKKQLWE